MRTSTHLATKPIHEDQLIRDLQIILPGLNKDKIEKLAQLKMTDISDDPIRILSGFVCFALVVTGGMAAQERGGSSRAVEPPALGVSASGRYLVDQKGDPFLVVGDTAWSLIAQGDDAMIDRYLVDRAKRGFNSIIVNLLEHKFAAQPPKTRAGIPPFKEPGDFSTPNDAYFDFARLVVERAGEQGIVVWLAPAYLGYGGGDEGFFKEIKAGGRDKFRAYGSYVGARTKAYARLVDPRTCSG